ncbi:MAG TPA: DUF4864 domain-containing protein [Burkholderiales bacterium]|jgi:hypothetical protein|nr:DUF4864 domain-containing protein [Burkholderiales bacterium]
MARSLFLAFLLLATASTAAEIPKEDAAAIRAVITEQLDAFARDDGPRAFSLATAGIRAQFGTAEVFMEMVKSQYAVVYRPKSVHFDPPELIEGQIIQPVRMTDDGGRTWMAIYPMLREGGRWRTNGCLLHRLQGLQT